MPTKMFDILIHAADGFNLFAQSPRIRQASIEYLKHQIQLARKIKAKCLTFHIANDVPFAINGVKHFGHQFYPQEYKKWVADGLEQVSRFANRRIKLGVENTAGYRYPFVQKIVDKLLGHGLFLTWDFGHTNCLKSQVKKSELAYFKRRKEFIINCHLHDNNRHIDQHLKIGSGTVRFGDYLNILEGTAPYLTIETRPKMNVLSSFIQLKKILKCRS